MQVSLWRSHVAKRRTAVMEVLRAGIERGILRPDTDIEASIDLINGVFYYQIVVRGCAFDDPDAMARCREAFETAWRVMILRRRDPKNIGSGPARCPSPDHGACRNRYWRRAAR